MSTTIESVSVPVPASIVKAAAYFVCRPNSRVRATYNAAALATSRIRISTASGSGMVESVFRSTFSSFDSLGAFFQAYQLSPSWNPSEEFGEAYVDIADIHSAMKAGFDSVEIGDGSARFGSVRVSAENATKNPLPAIPDYSPETLALWKLSVRELADIVSDVGSASDNESSRYALGGILIESDGFQDRAGFRRIHAVASDGRRLHVRTFSDFRSADTVSVLIPAYIFSAVVKAVKATVPRGVAGKNSSVEIEFRSGSARFRWSSGDWQISIFVPTMEGRFPRWRDIIPDDMGNETLSVFYDELIPAMKSAAAGVCRREKNDAYRLRGVILDSRDDAGGRGRLPRFYAKNSAGEFESLPRYGSATPEFSIRLDPEFIVDAVPSSTFSDGPGKSGEVVNFRTKAGGRDACFITFGGGIRASNGPGWTAVIMPMNAD